jgi:hypothetical protein
MITVVGITSKRGVNSWQHVNCPREDMQVGGERGRVVTASRKNCMKHPVCIVVT